LQLQKKQRPAKTNIPLNLFISSVFELVSLRPTVSICCRAGIELHRPGLKCLFEPEIIIFWLISFSTGSTYC
jgi:hypothetical protein